MSSIPPPPLSNPNLSLSQQETIIAPQNVESCRQALRTATKRLEQARCQESDLEASLFFASSLLKHKDDLEFDLSDSVPGGIRDAWTAVAATTKPDQRNTELASFSAANETLHLGSGLYAKAVLRHCIDKSLKRAAEIAGSIQANRRTDGPALEAWVKAAKSVPSEAWLFILDERLQEIQAYHSKHANPLLPTKRQRLGNPSVDGYDLVGSVVQAPIDVDSSDAEVMGKYLALESLYEEALETLKDVFVGETTTDDQVSAKSAFLYPDFLQQLDKLHLLSETSKLQHRRKYSRLLTRLQAYLRDFLQRTIPLFNLAKCLEAAIEAFEATWRKTGGAKGWQEKSAEANMLVDAADRVDVGATVKDTTQRLVDLSKFDTAEQLVDQVDADMTKAELARLGLKCGGTPLDRAKRLLMTKNTPLKDLPAKLFVKKLGRTASDITIADTIVTLDRRVDIARQEAIVAALLDQLAPTLDATIRRAERRLTQTLEEQDKEVEEELFGNDFGRPKIAGGDDDDDSEDGPIYNPKNVPLDFDGKPIPYWLFKLHGLNHYYPCEICGGETYRGRRNFELHFADAKHSLGMRSLGIPNTKHFHGVTTIQDAQELWTALQMKLQHEQFDNGYEEEYEDSNGNILSRATYEDLARQGLL
ncbi:hypothetical protein MPSEU_000880900 [Mayamaea pseudoterrestris]|nr:hypothetical protein MPSEU_000880900 [Mayamaea pseudoterrestris]